MGRAGEEPEVSEMSLGARLAGRMAGLQLAAPVALATAGGKGIGGGSKGVGRTSSSSMGVKGAGGGRKKTAKVVVLTERCVCVMWCVCWS